MKNVFYYFALSISIFFIGCKSNSMSGVYVCDQLNKKADTVINHGNVSGEVLDLTCLFQELNFKGNSTVELKMKNGPVVSDYVVDNGYIRINGSGSALLLLKVIDNKTLSSEGVFGGIYHKK